MNAVFGVLLALIVSGLGMAAIIFGTGMTYGSLARYAGVDMPSKSLAPHGGNLNLISANIKKLNVSKGTTAGCEDACEDLGVGSSCSDKCDLICDTSGDNSGCLKVNGTVESISQNDVSDVTIGVKGKFWWLKSVDVKNTSKELFTVHLGHFSSSEAKKFTFFIPTYDQSPFRSDVPNTTLRFLPSIGGSNVTKHFSDKANFTYCANEGTCEDTALNKCRLEFVSSWWDVSELNLQPRDTCNGEMYLNTSESCKTFSSQCDSSKGEVCCYDHSASDYECKSNVSECRDWSDSSRLLYYCDSGTNC